jgi:hypothetical protein
MEILHIFLSARAQKAANNAIRPEKLGREAIILNRQGK